MFSTNTVVTHETANILQRYIDKSHFLLLDNIVYSDKYNYQTQHKINTVLLNIPRC